MEKRQRITAKRVKACGQVLHSEGRIVFHVGAASEDQKIKSWAEPTKAVHGELIQAKATIYLAENAPRIVLHGEKDKSGNREKLDLPKGRAAQLNIKRLKAPIDAYEGIWSKHKLTLRSEPVVTFIQRVFNVQLDHGGRFYGPFQNLPKSDRNQLLIDGESTVELDFKAIHPHMLYAWNGKQLDSDPYETEGFDRDVIKTVCLMLPNTKSASGFKSLITKSSKPESKAEYAEYKAKVAKNKAAGLRQRKAPKKFKYFMEGLPDNLDGKAVYQSICDRHSEIVKYFHTPCLGVRLQFQDSKIMASILSTLAKEKIPVVPIHDSVVCKARHQARVKEVMQQVWFERYGLTIPVELAKKPKSIPENCVPVKPSNDGGFALSVLVNGRARVVVAG